MPKPNDKGVAMTVVIIVVIMLTMLAAYATTLSYNQRKLADSALGHRAKVYYRAQAGIVEANWRIRTNYTVGLSPPGNFSTPAYNPAPYLIDVDGDGVINDCWVDIGPLDASNRRSISSKGLDN